MIATIVIFAWLTQSVLAYILFKKIWLHNFKEWTVGNRNAHLLFSIMPFGLVISGIAYCTLMDDDKPSSW